MSTLEQDLEKARATAEQWERKAAAARVEAQQIDETAGAEILADPTAAERVPVRVQAKEREARAYDAGAVEARARVDGVFRKHLEADLKRLVKDAAARRREADDHRRKSVKLLEQLRDLEGVEYEPVFGRPSEVVGNVYYSPVPGPSQTRTSHLAGEADAVDLQIALVEFYLEHGRRPTWNDGGYLHSIAATGLLAEVLEAKAAAR